MAFSKISEKHVTKAIVSEFAKEFEDHVENDVIIIGGGYGLGLPFVGFLLDLDWGSAAEAYRGAFLSIPVGIAAGILMLVFMREKKIA